MKGASTEATQATKGRFQPPSIRRSNEAPNSELNGGWQEVISRRRRKIEATRSTQPKPRSAQPKPRFTSQKVQEGFNQAIKQRKCFRCLAVGHQRVQCREPPRCFNCNKFGHFSSRCTINRAHHSGKGKEKGIELKPKPQTDHTKTYAQTVGAKAKMAEYEEEFMEERPEEVDVFLPANTELRPQCSYLSSSAIIKLIRGAQSRDLPWAIKQTLAELHGGFPEHYQVHQTDGQTYILICVNQTIRNRIVAQGPYEIPLAGVRIVLERWTHTIGMTFWPNEFQAWVKIIGLPYNLWNEEDLHRAVARVGAINYTMPYGIAAGQFEHITLYMDTRHPRHIPKFLRVRIGNFSRRVRVQLLGWRIRQDGYFPPPVPPNQTQPAQLNRQRYTAYQPPARPRCPHRQPEPSDSALESNGDSSEYPWGTQNKPITSQAMAKRQQKIWVPKPAVIPVQDRRWVLINEKSITKPAAEPVKNNRWVLVTPKPAPEGAATETTENDQRITTPKGAQVTIQSTARMATRWATQVITVIWQLGEALIMCGGKVKYKISKTPFTFSPISINFLLVRTDVHVSNMSVLGSENKGTFLENIHTEGSENIHTEGNSGTQEQGNSSGAEESPQSPQFPPGFEAWAAAREEFKKQKPTTTKGRAQKGSNPTRRSPRLKKKLSGPYTTIMEKAIAIKGRGMQAQRKLNCKPATPPQVNLDYFRTLDPLSQIQAEVVIMTAGVEGVGEIADQIEKIVKAGEETLLDPNPTAVPGTAAAASEIDPIAGLTVQEEAGLTGEAGPTAGSDVPSDIGSE